MIYKIKDKYNVVVGGGITGLLAALIFSEIYKKDVLLIEKEKKLGGLLKCFDYGKYGLFDYGMHNMYKSGIEQLDNLLISLLPKNAWVHLDGNKRDLAGTIFNNKIQYNSAYPDLRNLSDKEWGKCTSDFFKQIEKPYLGDINNAWDYLNSQFGLEIAKIIDGILYKIFGHNSFDLSPFAPNIVNLSRVIMFSEDIFSEMIDIETIRKKIAWPEQRTLAVKYQSGHGSYYPLDYGIFRLVDAFEERLKISGVKILKQAEIKNIELVNNRVDSIKISQSGITEEINDIDNFIWTSGIPPIAKLTNINLSACNFDIPKKLIILNLLLNKKPKMKDLYYLYNYQLNSKIFRVTDFSNYCPNAKRSQLWPLSIELLYEKDFPSDNQIIKNTVQELIRYQIIESIENIEFKAIEKLNSGPPMPTTNNFKNIQYIRDSINNLKIHNLYILGILSEENIFFQRDVINSTWNKINLICQK